MSRRGLPETCEDLNCFNGGTCVQLPREARCYCLPGYSGLLCETRLDGNDDARMEESQQRGTTSENSISNTDIIATSAIIVVGTIMGVVLIVLMKKYAKRKGVPRGEPRQLFRVVQDFETPEEAATYMDMADTLQRNQDYIPHHYRSEMMLVRGSGDTLPYGANGFDNLGRSNPTYARSISVPRGSFSSDMTSVSRSSRERGWEKRTGSGGSTTLPPRPTPAQRPHHLVLIGERCQPVESEESYIPMTTNLESPVSPVSPVSLAAGSPNSMFTDLSAGESTYQNTSDSLSAEDPIFELIN